MTFLSDHPYPTPAVQRLHEQLRSGALSAPEIRYEVNLLDEVAEVSAYYLPHCPIEIDGHRFQHAILYETIVHVSLWGFDDRERLEAEWSRLLDLAMV